MSSELTASIVRVVGPRGATVGTGFVVTDDGLVATCAHVVAAAGATKESPPSGEVQVGLAATGDLRTARIEPGQWLSCDDGDVAILRIEGDLPDQVPPLPLGGSGGTKDHPFTAFGYPPPQAKVGMLGGGTIVGPGRNEKDMPLIQLRSTEVTPGFSGAPVWDERTRRVVGMVSAITPPDRYARLAQTAFATPSETLRQVCPVLQLSEVCPYQGLQPFTETDAEFFQGRTRVVDNLLKHIRAEPPLVAVLGPSGSGKSSVVQAGLVAGLRGNNGHGGKRWGAVLTRRYDEPLTGLADAGLTGADHGLIEAVQQWLNQQPEQTRLLIILDQFEELLVTCPESQRRAFVDQLTRLLGSPTAVTVVLTMRDDFYSRLTEQAPDLMDTWVLPNLVQVPSELRRDELVAMVETPAKTIGLTFDEGLAEDIVNDTIAAGPIEVNGERAARSTVLPLLEFALTELWERRQDSRLTRAAYDELGCVTGGLPQWANRAYCRLDDDQQRLARRIFIDLIHFGDAQRGVPDSRQRLPLDALCRPGEDRQAVEQVVQRLIEARLLVASRAGRLTTVQGLAARDETERSSDVNSANATDSV